MRHAAVGLVLLAACADTSVVATTTDEPTTAPRTGTVRATPTPTPAPGGPGGNVGGGATPTPAPGSTTGTTRTPTPGGLLPTLAPTPTPSPRPTFAPTPTAAPTTIPVGQVLATAIRVSAKGKSEPLPEPATLSVDPGAGNEPIQQGWELDIEAFVTYTDPGRLDKDLTIVSNDTSIVTVAELAAVLPLGGTSKYWRLVGKKPGKTSIVLQSLTPSDTVGGVQSFITRSFAVEVSGEGRVTVEVR
ncbi:MAG: hypothetical protein VKO64_12060 [Candidatus Sericytochromatia bacterium]|nr:hypothetical protein [Candidatus Sericytochromatia bacterium]